MRKEFFLPESDIDFLTSLGLLWETFKEGNMSWLIIKNFSVPEGYNVRSVDAAITIQPGYPVSQLDMVYFYPHLQLLSGKTIGAIAFQPLNGNIFQRWSRHRTGTNPWRPGIDDLSTHITLINFWLERELQK
jgi:hypothetical protein